MSNTGLHAAEDGSLARSTGGAAARGAMLIALALAIGLLLMFSAFDDPGTVVDVASASTTDTADDGGEGADAGADPSVDAGADPVIEDPAVNVGTPDEGADASASPPPTIGDVGGEADPAAPVVEGEIFPNNEVNVLVANGTGERGVAGTVRDRLTATGYIGVVSNAPSTAAAVVFYQPGFSANARQVAEVLGAPPDVVTAAPTDGTIAVNADAINDGRLAAANIIVIIGDDGAVPTS